MSLKTFAGRFFDKFFKDETTTLAASLAFYTALSLAPILILFVIIAAQVSPELQTELMREVKSLMGVEASQAVAMVIEGARDRTDLTSVASLFGAITLLVSASLIFGELRAALNRIFEVPVQEPTNASVGRLVLDYLRQRLLHCGLALIFILTLIISLVSSSVISATFHSNERLVAFALNISISLLFYMCLFTVVFRYLPDRAQPWKCALQGGALTAVMFVIGKELIGLYLGNSAIGSAYGAAGSVIALLVWVYYSTMITFIGAQVSSILMNLRPRRTV